MSFLALNNGLLLKQRYIVEKLLGSGSYGQVYLCRDLDSSQSVAIKVEPTDKPSARLIHEGNMYTAVQGGKGMPEIYWYGTDGEYNLIVMQLLGPSLSDLYAVCKKEFSMKTVLMLGDQMIGRVKFCHERNIVHRDVKPANLLMGTGRLQNLVYLVDFGLAKKYLDTRSGKHIPYREEKGMTGTPRYASLNAHLGRELSRRDDMESIGYIMMYLLKTNLPWEHLRGANKDQKYDMITEKKLSTPVGDLCKDLPIEFSNYLNYCRLLGFEDQPDYSYLRVLFRKLIRNMNMTYDFVFDWQSREGILT